MHESCLRLLALVLFLAACTPDPSPLPTGGAGGSGGGSGGGGGNLPDASEGGGQSIDADAIAALQIVQVQVLKRGDCTVPSTATGESRTSGRLDLALPDGSEPGYYLPVLVANNLDSSGGAPGTEMNNVTLTHFTIELSAPNFEWANACPATFDTPAVSYLLAPRATAGVSLDVLTPLHSRCLVPYLTAAPFVVTATIRAKGHHGGTSIASAPLVFPIEVCAGCLQQGYIAPALIQYQYPADIPLCSALTGSNPYVGDVCASPGQDEKILCCGLPTTIGGTTQTLAVCPGVFAGN